jgi:hypothetical protein
VGKKPGKKATMTVRQQHFPGKCLTAKSASEGPLSRVRESMTLKLLAGQKALLAQVARVRSPFLVHAPNMLHKMRTPRVLAATCGTSMIFLSCYQ